MQQEAKSRVCVAALLLECRHNELERLLSSHRFAIKKWLEGETQQTIAKWLGIAQPSVNYIIHSVKICHIRSLLQCPSPEEIEQAIQGLDPLDQEVFRNFLEYETQLGAAGKLGRSQGFVRYRLIKGLRKIPPGVVSAWIQMLRNTPKMGKMGFQGRVPFEKSSLESLVRVARQVVQTHESSISSS